MVMVQKGRPTLSSLHVDPFGVNGANRQSFFYIEIEVFTCKSQVRYMIFGRNLCPCFYVPYNLMMEQLWISFGAMFCKGNDAHK